jgi:hypothetical protein
MCVPTHISNLVNGVDDGMKDGSLGYSSVVSLWGHTTSVSPSTRLTDPGVEPDDLNFLGQKTTSDMIMICFSS